MQYRYAKFTATRYLQSAGERNVMFFERIMHSPSRLIALLYCAFLLSGCGPGVSDGEFHINKNYYLSDAGHHEKIVIKRNEKGLSDIVIDARVDGWIVKNNSLLVSRTPRAVYVENGVAHTALEESIEYYEINLETNVVAGPFSSVASIPISQLTELEIQQLTGKK